MAKLRFGSYTFEISNQEKLFFPKAGLTKGDLIDYYRKVADSILPHLKGRPLSLQRFPDGIQEEGFFQKEAPDYFPDWIERSSLEKKEGGRIVQTICENEATLAYLADQGCVTFHPWLSRNDRPNYPDRMVFDLDPTGEDFKQVIFAAKALRGLLSGELGLNAYVMTTGQRGLHVAVPLRREDSFDRVRSFARRAAEMLAERHSERLTTEVRRNKRKGRLFLDIARNAYAQTSVAPYSVRPRPGAPVAAPLEWNELDHPKAGPQMYRIENILRRLGQKEDPWKGIARRASSLETARSKLK
jgi:bifunctional non-homologous end joining protein LigD